MNYATVTSTNKYMVAIFMVHFMPVVAFTGPSAYLYIRSILTDDARLQRKDWLHLIPALLFFINNFKFYFFFSFDKKLAIAEQMIKGDRSLVMRFDPLIFSGEYAYFIRSASAIVYMVVCIVIVYQHFKNDFRRHLQNVLVFRWIIMLLAFNLIMNFSIGYVVARMLYSWQTDNKGIFIHPYAFYISLGSLAILNLTLFFFPSILYGLPRMDYYVKTQEKQVDQAEKAPILERTTKEFEISIEKLQIIEKKIDGYLIDQPYLRANFTLASMSSEINIPVHHLSYFFNEYLHVDFTSWRNGLRIDHVIQLMDQGMNQHLTLDALSKQAGFNSRTTFINAFKQRMNLTPSEYLNSL